MATVYRVNGQNLRADYGLIVQRVERRRWGPSRKTTQFELQGRAGAFLGTTRWGASRRQVTGVIQATSVVLRETAEDKIRAILENGVVTLEVDHGSGIVREFDGVLEGEPQFQSFEGNARAARVSFELLTSSPYWYATQGRPLSFGATRKAVQLGPAPSGGVLEIMGSATNPELKYRGADGIVRKSMAFTVTLTSSQFLRLDLDAQTIVQVNSGVEAAPPTWTGNWVSLDPQDGDYENAAWPTLEVTAGSGLLVYREAYL